MMPETISNLDGKYLTFVLGDEEYGIDALKVQGILSMQPVTPMPHAPHYFKGVATVRGQVVPIIGARARLGMPDIETTPETCIILVSCDEVGVAGIVVDTVRDVLDISRDSIEDPPALANAGNGVVGLAKTGDRVQILLDIGATLGDMTGFGGL